MPSAPESTSKLWRNSSADKFIYKPLPRDDYIRLIEFYSFGDDVELRIRHFRLSEVPAYTALSYAWGPSKRNDMVEIICDWQVLKVTQNCKDALEQLAKCHSTSFFLWVDAICINQAHTEPALSERSNQLQLMCSIYKQAEQTLVWLGKDSDHAGVSLLGMKIAFEGTRRQQSVYTRPRRTKSLSDLQAPSDTVSEDASNEEAEIDKFLELEMMLYAPLHKLLRRDWFGRLWILQEVVVARQVVVMCGNRSISWDILHHIAQTMLAVQSTSEIKRLVRLGRLRKSYQQSGSLGLSIYEAIVISRRQQCTDQRDRIWGICGISPELALIVPKPDSTATLRQLREHIFQNYLLSAPPDHWLFRTSIMVLNLCARYTSTKASPLLFNIALPFNIYLLVSMGVTFWAQHSQVRKELFIIVRVPSVLMEVIKGHFAKMLLVLDLFNVDELDGIQSSDELDLFWYLWTWDIPFLIHMFSLCLLQLSRWAAIEDELSLEIKERTSWIDGMTTGHIICLLGAHSLLSFLKKASDLLGDASNAFPKFHIFRFAHKLLGTLDVVLIGAGYGFFILLNDKLSVTLPLSPVSLPQSTSDFIGGLTSFYYFHIATVVATYWFWGDSILMRVSWNHVFKFIFSVFGGMLCARTVLARHGVEVERRSRTKILLESLMIMSPVLYGLIWNICHKLKG